jgi:hypothetical protein
MPECRPAPDKRGIIAKPALGREALKNPRYPAKTPASDRASAAAAKSPVMMIMNMSAGSGGVEPFNQRFQALEFSGFEKGLPESPEINPFPLGQTRPAGL